MSSEIELKRELRYKEQRYRMFAESVIEAVLFHEDGMILDANKAAESIFKIPAEQMMGRQTIEFIAEGTGPMCCDAFAITFKRHTK